ncbi:amidase family protein, partial [Streptomyces mirabilis]
RRRTPSPHRPPPASSPSTASHDQTGPSRHSPGPCGWTNLTSHVGLPSLVIPVTATEEGLPTGVQIIGPAYADHVLIALAEELTPLLRAIASGASS